MSAPFEMVIVKEEPCEYSDVAENPIPEEDSPKPSSSSEIDGQTWFACVFCNSTFLEAHQVIEHAETAHLQDYVCHKCKSKFKNKSTLFSHQIQEDCKERPYYYPLVSDNRNCGNSYVNMTDKESIQENELAPGNFPTRANRTFQNEAPITDNIIHVPLNEEQPNIPRSSAIDHHENIAFLRKTFNASFSAKNFVVVPCIYCPTCDKNFDVNFYMDSHLETRNVVACRCPYCILSVGIFKCNIQLAGHLVMHFKDKPSIVMYHCTTRNCNYTFFSNMNLKHHKKMCGVECKPVKSSSESMIKDSCRSALESIVKSLKFNSIQQHRTTIACIYCADCKSDFNIDFYMLTHMVQNVSDKMTCRCFMCGALFLDTMEKYVLHLQSHITEKNKMDMFFCSRAHCNAAFFTAENQKQHYKAIHMKTINEIKNPCSGFLYDPSDTLSNMKKCTYDHLERHRSIVYQKSKLFTMMIHCRICCNAFPFQTYIFKHIESCGLISCPFCTGNDQSSLTLSKWFSHFWANHSGFINVSAFCQECNYAFYNSYNLAAHVKEEHALIKESDLRDSDIDYVFPPRKNSKKIKYDPDFTMDQGSSSSSD